MAIIPRQHDILFGKGAAINSHHGNKRFRLKVEMEKPRFRQAKRQGKREMAEHIVAEIENAGIRFLMEDPDSIGKSKKRVNDGMNGSSYSQYNNPNRLSEFVTDPSILARVWMPVPTNKKTEKVMHRMREKSQNLPDMAAFLGDNAGGGMATTSMTSDAIVGAHKRNEEESKAASNNVPQHHDVGRVGASQTSHSMNRVAHASAPPIIRIQSTHASAPISSIQSTFLPQVGGVALAPIRLSLNDWVRSNGGYSSKDGYIKGAVNISWMLTNQLIQSIAAAQVTLLDITVEKVIVCVVPPPPSAQQYAGGVVVQSVQFPLLAQRNKWRPISSRAACAALGSILLHIFSMGRSISSLGIPSGRAIPHSDCSVRHSGDHALSPPAQKRRAVEPSNNSIFSGAMNLLAQLGTPLSIQRMVCDLLHASTDKPYSNSALTSLGDALYDLTQMKISPQSFLFDRTCQLKATVDTGLFVNTDMQLYGREKELGALMTAMKNVSNHVRMGGSSQGSNFVCEAAFLSGYAGAGKSSLLRSLVHACNEDKWFVFNVKFDKQTAPHMAIAKGVELFFQTWESTLKGDNSDANPMMREAFNQISPTIGKITGNELCEIIPSLARFFPQKIAPKQKQNQEKGTSSNEKVGCANKRRQYLFEVIAKALCSVGVPLLVCFDDLQAASESFAMDLVANFINNLNDTSDDGKETRRKGVFFVGTFRSNEVKSVDDLIGKIDNLHLSKKIKSSARLTIHGLGADDIAKWLSAIFCLPTRYTNELAAIVASKSRGNPFFIVQFLKSIIENRWLEFSVRHGRWVWDNEVIDMKLISDGVAELLAARFNQLPLSLAQAIKIVSLFGSQIDRSTVDLLDLCLQVTFNIQESLSLAIKEGFIERAGPIYQFTHDIIQTTIYELIPVETRNLLHRSAGIGLLQFAANDSSIHLLAVDQINLSCSAENAAVSLEPEIRASFAKVNVTAAKYAIAASSFEQARSYIDAGMQYLHEDHWDSQYSLSLKLYELSASVSCSHGDRERMSSNLNAIAVNVRQFEDSLYASSLLAKLLASQTKYDEAMENCILVLSNLGEEISQDVSFQEMVNELEVVQSTLANITVEQVKLLPIMTDKSKLNAMKFLSMLCTFSIGSKPMLVPILSCRMVRLTIENGTCDDSIVGLATAAYGLFTFKDDIQLGYRIGKVCDTLIEDSPNRHSLRSRLCRELDCTLKMMIEPQQSVVPLLHDRFSSAMIVGDVEAAMHCLVVYCTAMFYTGENLVRVSKAYLTCIEQSKKYQQNDVLYLAMANFRCCTHLTGRSNDEVGIKTYEELEVIARSTNDNRLLFRTFMSQMDNYFYDRKWIKLMELSGKWPPSKYNRILVVGRAFYTGVASLRLANKASDPVTKLKLRSVGEEALNKLNKWALASKWNFENRAKLVQAELHYLDGDLELAEAAYKAAITSSHKHKWFSNHALACELYGIFCVENHMVDKGAGQLHIALDKYTQWGAMKKVADLQNYIDGLRKK